MRCQGFYSPGLEEPKGCWIRETEINELTYLSRHISPSPMALSKQNFIAKDNYLVLSNPAVYSWWEITGLLVPAFYSFPSKARGIMLRIVIVIVQKEKAIKALFRCEQWVASSQEQTLHKILA